MMVLRRASSYAPTVVACGALLSACLAMLGYGMLGFLFASRYYAPASSHYIRPLHFDYTGYVAIAYAPLSPEPPKQLAPKKGQAPPPNAVLPKSRFLPSGTQVGVYVRLLIPSDHTDLFQVTGELLTNGSHVAARSARTHINTPQPAVYRFAKHMLLLPFHVVGLGHGDWATVDLPLFDSYEEREDEPVEVFRARLASRNASRGGLPPPPVYRAELHVRLRLGPIQTALLWLRPGLVAGWVLLLVGVSAATSGTFGTIGLLLLAFLLRRYVKASEVSGKGKRAGGRRRSGAALTAPPRQKHDAYAPPFGDANRAIMYSLENAQFYRGGGDGSGHGGRAALVEEYGDEDDVSYGQRPYAADRISRQASGFSRASPPPPTGPQLDVEFDKSPGWSGTSSGESTYAPTPSCKAGNGGADNGDVHFPPSRKASGAASMPAEPATDGAAAAAAAAAPNGAWAPPLQVTESGGNGDLGGAADMEFHRGGSRDEEGSSQGEGEEGDSEDGDSQSEEAGGEEEGEEEARGLATPGKAPVAEQAGEGRRGDLEPEADNEAVGGAVRKRSGFAWQA